MTPSSHSPLAVHAPDSVEPGARGSIVDDLTIVADENDHDVDDATRLDGRHARSERSRQAMIDSLLDLLREGNLRPSATQIADRAGVTQRTLFNQFGDMETLVRACATTQAVRVVNMLPEAGEGDLEQRVAAYGAGLAHMLEETMNVRWAIVTTTNTIWNGDHVMQTAREFMRAHVANAFAGEIEAIGEDAATGVLDALEISLDPAAWRLLRVQHDMPTETATAAIQRSILSVLRDALA